MIVFTYGLFQQRIKPTAPWVVLAEVIAFNRRGGSYLSLGGNKK